MKRNFGFLNFDFGLAELRVWLASRILGKAGWARVWKPFREAQESSERRWERSYEEACQRADKLRENMANELRGRLEALYYRRPGIVVGKPDQARRDLERLMVLAGMDERNALWQTVLSYADESEQDERKEALGPNLSNDARTYNNGRAAHAYDFATALRELYAEAQRKAKAGQGET